MIKKLFTGDKKRLWISLYAQEPRHIRKVGQTSRMGSSWVKAHTEEF